MTAPPKERTNEKGERGTREKRGTKARQRGRERMVEERHPEQR